MQNSQYQIDLITETQMPAAGKLLAEAFCADPLMVALFPEEQERERVLTWYYTATVRSLAAVRGVYTTAGPVLGVAVWDPPGTQEEAPAWAETGDGLGYRRFLQAIDYLAPLRQAALSGPFWYLSWIGVASDQQGKRLGSSLLAPVLQQADRAGLPCYLETFDQKNLFFYRPHGFEVVLSRVEPVSNIPFWTLKREPR